MDFERRRAPRRDAPPARPRRAPPFAPYQAPTYESDERSNQSTQQQVQPAPAPVIEAPKQDALGQAAAGTRQEVAIYRTLRVGSEGEDVKTLQRLLGLTGDDVDGKFGNGTKGLVIAWQEKQGLKPDGIVGKDSVRQLRGDPAMYGYSWHHDPAKFVPTYAMTAYHESGIYRTETDPYAVGAITRPDKDDDLGGKTYGTYQFESYVYRDGTKAKDSLVDNSTVMRFVRSGKNPFGKQLQEVVSKHGIASAEFDALWKKLSSEQNKAFGDAQQAFLEEDKEATVQAFLTRAKASAEVTRDADIKDLVMGTTNHVGTLANGAADHLAELQDKAGRKLTVDQFGQALCDYKSGRVSSWFQSSPGAQAGIKNRFAQERTVFE